MRKQRVTQQGIVFGIFVLLFVGFSLFLPGFLTPDNMIALLQNVAVLGILSLGMAIVIIGRGIDLSMIATLAVPPGLILQMVQNGHSVTEAFAAAARSRHRLWSRQRLADRLCRSPFVVHDAGVRPFPGRIGPGVFLPAGCRSMERETRPDRVDRSRHLVWRAYAHHHVRLGGACGRLVSAAHAPRRLCLRDRRQSVRRPDDGHSNATGYRPAIPLGGADRCVRGPGFGGLRQQHGDADLQLDTHLRRYSGLRAGRHRTFRRTRRRLECGHRHAARSARSSMR